MLVLAVVLAAGTAYADRATALKYFRSGEKAYSAQNFGDAARSFDQAFAELPLPEIAFSAAQAYRRQYRVEHKREYVERAVTLYRFYLDKRKTGGRVGDAADNLGEMEAELARLGGAPKEAAVVVTQLGVTVNLAGAAPAATTLEEVADDKPAAPAVPVTATLDGKPIETDKMIDVPPGDHVFHVEAKGYAPADKKGHALEGRSDFVEIDLQPLPAHLALATEAGARVSIDGRGAGTAPIAAVALAAGRHVVTIASPGRVPVAREFDVANGETLSLRAPLARTTQRKVARWVAIGAGGLGVLTGIAAIGAAVEDGHASDRLAELRMGSQDASVLDAYRTAHRRRDAFVTATWIGGGATLAVGATALVLFLADRPSAEGVRVTPYVAETAGGASVIGRF